MKRFSAFLLVVCSIFFVGCSTNETSDKEVTCAEVIAAYEEKGYKVFHKEADVDEDIEYNCYVRVSAPETDDYAYFHFFDNHQEALAFKKKAPYATIGIGLFSLILGKPTWVRVKTYNQIEIEYDNAELYNPFKQLLRNK